MITMHGYQLQMEHYVEEVKLKDITGKRIYEKDHIEFDCKSVQETPLVAEVYYSTDKFQWRCKAINHQQSDAVLDFDLAFVMNKRKCKSNRKIN